MKYAFVAVPAAPIRKKMGHRNEMVNQLLFGEAVKLLKAKDELWVKVRSLHDGYEGWMTINMLEETDELTANIKSVFLTADLLSVITIGDKKMNIPFGSSLPFFNKGNGKLGKIDYSYTGNYCKKDEQLPTPDLINKLVSDWMNVPYLWGGRTALGIDCSGFVQLIFKMMNIDLPRDAYLQAKEGREVVHFSDVQPGDLAFFNNEEDIVHTGILVNNNLLIHAQGKVKTDRIDENGVVDTVTGKRILKLKSVRRIF